MADPDYKQLFQGLRNRLSTGGQFLQSSLADIAAGKRRGISSAMQGLVSSGLSGTTVRAGIPIAAEEVAGRARLAARGAAEQQYAGITSQFAHLGEASRQAALERAAAMDRTRMMANSQETMQIRGMQGPSMASQGLDIFGQPMRGSLAETQANYMKWRMSQPGGGQAMSSSLGGGIGSSGGIGGIGGQGNTYPSWMGSPGDNTSSRTGATFTVPGFRRPGSSIGAIQGAGAGVTSGIQAEVEANTMPDDTFFSMVDQLTGSSLGQMSSPKHLSFEAWKATKGDSLKGMQGWMQRQVYNADMKRAMG